jgi:phosphoglycerate dehydrogenase-like enzyme
MTDPLVLGVSCPALIDLNDLREAGRNLGRPLDLRVIPYAESLTVRNAKADGADGAALRSLEPELSAVQRADLADLEGLVAVDVPLDLVRLAPRLRWVQAAGAGVGHLIRALRGSPAVLTTSAGVAAPSIAEFVMARLLQVWKDLRELDAQQAEHRWEPRHGAVLSGQTVAIVGLGAIGNEVARRADAFGMRVLGIRRRASLGAPGPYIHQVFPSEDMVAVLRESHALVLAAPATAATKALIGPAELAALPVGAVVCNVARGSLLDERAVVSALRAGHLRAAILDVTQEEPLGTRSDLWAQAGVYLSPHCAASMDDYRARFTALVASNLGRYVSGSPLLNRAEPVRGY